MKKEESSKNLTLADALEKGIVVERKDVDKMIEDALVTMKKKIREEISQEMAVAKNKMNENVIDSYLTTSRLTNKDFVRELMALNISAMQARGLRDEHFNIRAKGKLDRRRIWDIIRAADK